MWLNENMISIFGSQTPQLEKLPLRVAALVDVATKAGLGMNRTRLGVLQLLREQSSAVLEQWRTMNMMKTIAVNNGAEPLINSTNMVALVVDVQTDCKETRLVSLLLYFYTIIFRLLYIF